MLLFTKRSFENLVVNRSIPRFQLVSTHFVFLLWVITYLILSLVATLVVNTLIIGCQIGKNSTPDYVPDAPWYPLASESTTQLLPPDQGSGETTSNLDASGLQAAPGLFRIVPNWNDYQAEWLLNERRESQDRSPFLTVPRWQNARYEWSASVHDEMIQQRFSYDLNNSRITINFQHWFDNRWTSGGSLSIESVAEKPLNNFNELTAEANVFLKGPPREDDAWLFSLSYTGKSEWPIPKVEFSWQPSTRFQAHIGLLVPVTDRPLDDLSVDFSMLLRPTSHR